MNHIRLRGSRSGLGSRSPADAPGDPRPAYRTSGPTSSGTVTKTAYDGITTTSSPRASARPASRGGAPAAGQSTAPTAAELRRLAIYNNYRALLDISPKGGYGVLYGPNVDINGDARSGEGKIAGTEYLAYADDGTRQAKRDADGADPGDVRHANARAS